MIEPLLAPDRFFRPTPRELTEYVRVAQVLPLEVRTLLKQISMIDPDVPVGGSKNRTEALDIAIQQVKRLHPHLFH